MRILIAILFFSMLNLAQAAEVAGVTFAENDRQFDDAKLLV